MIRIRKLEFIQQGGMTFPKDIEFSRAVQNFCEAHLSAPINLATYADVFVALDDRTGEILGITGWQQAIDISLFRVKSHAQARNSTKKLIDRLNDFFHDRGCRGMEALIFIADEETEEQRCPKWKEWLKAVKARSSQRRIVTIK